MKTKIMASWEYPENLDCMTPCWLWSHMSSLYDLCTMSTKTGAAIATWRENLIVAFISGTGGPLWIQKQFPVLNCATVQALLSLRLLSLNAEDCDGHLCVGHRLKALNDCSSLFGRQANFKSCRGSSWFEAFFLFADLTDYAPASLCTSANRSQISLSNMFHCVFLCEFKRYNIELVRTIKMWSADEWDATNALQWQLQDHSKCFSWNLTTLPTCFWLTQGRHVLRKQLCDPFLSSHIASFG